MQLVDSEDIEVMFSFTLTVHPFDEIEVSATTSSTITEEDLDWNWADRFSESDEDTSNRPTMYIKSVSMSGRVVI